MTQSLTSAEPSGSFRTPRLGHATVRDAMRAGVLACPESATLREVARTMATHHVHCVVVSDGDPAAGAAWGILSDLDLVAGALAGSENRPAREAAATELITVRRDGRLEDAARTMTEHELRHVVVVDGDGEPVGVLSTLDIAGIVAWGES